MHQANSVISPRSAVSAPLIIRTVQARSSQASLILRLPLFDLHLHPARGSVRERNHAG